MNRKQAERLATTMRQAGERSARAVYDTRAGEWIAKTSGGATVRGAFDWHLARAKLKRAARAMRATVEHLEDQDFDAAHRRLEHALDAVL